MTKTRYICIGENYRDDWKLGYCGDIHMLSEWIEILFSDKVEQARKYFEGARDKEVIEYLIEYKGKRLKKI